MAKVSLEDGRSLEGSHQKKKRKREEDQPEKFGMFEEKNDNGASSILGKLKSRNSTVWQATWGVVCK